MTANDGTQERAAQMMPGRDELRVRLGLAARAAVVDAGTEGWLPVADAILAEIGQAGYCIIAADRWERVRNAATCYLRIWIDECDGDTVCGDGNAGLRHSDLDAQEGGR